MRHESLILRRVGEIRQAEVITPFTHALDLADGQPAGHSIRCCFIAATLARELGLDPLAAGHVHYAALVKGLGCTSDAALIHRLYRTCDIGFKRAWWTIAPGRLAQLRFMLDTAAAGSPRDRRGRAIGRVLATCGTIAPDLLEVRGACGAAVARELRLPEDVAQGVHAVDEHWDGSGWPDGRRGEAIPLAARIALLARVADAFHQAAGRQAAVDEVTRRAGSWLDPQLARGFARLAARPRFWAQAESSTLEVRIAAMAPEGEEVVDEDYLDAVAAAFGRIIDAKSTFTAGRSARVAGLAEQLGERLGVVPSRLRRLRRAALLHDIGMLGVSCAITEKPGALDASERAVVRTHAAYTQTILGRIAPFAEVAALAAAHHERLDGRGYPLGLKSSALALETRIITLCDVFDALTSERAWRAAMTVEQALVVMQADAGTAFDPEGFEALAAVAGA